MKALFSGYEMRDAYFSPRTSKLHGADPQLEIRVKRSNSETVCPFQRLHFSKLPLASDSCSCSTFWPFMPRNQIRIGGETDEGRTAFGGSIILPVTVYRKSEGLYRRNTWRRFLRVALRSLFCFASRRKRRLWSSSRECILRFPEEG